VHKRNGIHSKLLVAGILYFSKLQLSVSIIVALLGSGQSLLLGPTHDTF